MWKAVVAMSGGVDSSVAAFLVQERGFDCIGVTMKLFDGEATDTGRTCCSLADVEDARSVAFRMNIPHYVLNFSAEFDDAVIRHFIETYERGATPNPCIECNRRLKFEKLLLRAQQLGFDYLVTGHYARIEESGGRFLLKKAADPKKDQSYVLYTLTQSQLAHTLFPLGDIDKGAVRGIAAERGFVNAAKRDSQDICFVPDGDYASYIERCRGKRAPEGDVIGLNGEVLGRHRGLIRYTIGQRRGLGLSFPSARYVAAKSVADNTVTLADERALYTQTLVADNINLIALDSLRERRRVTVKTRYLQQEQAAVAEQIAPDRVRVDFDHPQRALTAGQAVVLYDGDVVLGGGTIV
jgi:tRNA-specific 2-thiouridylase